MLSFRRCNAMCLALLLLPFTASFAQDFKKQVIYQIVTDRFYNGSHANDDPAVSKGLYDPTHTNWQAYWGGDLQGIQQKMAYLKAMGVTALWISPVVDNENKPMAPPSLAPYHAYHARDFMKVDEHFGDANNGWAAFDSFVSSAHSNGMKVVLDWANNHSNNEGDGEKGALYNNGTLMATYANDPDGIFHHTATMSQDADYNDRFKVQYWSLAGLSDLNQESSTVDAYLKSAAKLFQSHGVDAFRLDAIKHVTWGWEYSFANDIMSNKPSFLFGEWMTDTGDPLYRDATKFANRSGIHELDFAFKRASQNVFGRDHSFQELEDAISTENKDYASPNDLVVFFDSHDEVRLMTLKNSPDRVNEALAFTLTCRGVPVILYGDEQYLHNDTPNGSNPPVPGGDPYDRVMMSSWSTKTTAYKLIKKLADLRQSNNALGYGTWQQRYVSNDVYIFERRFFGSIVLVAINKNEATAKPITGLLTSLPAGAYSDYLGGLMSGQKLTVSAGSGDDHPATALTLPAHSVSVWQVKAAASVPEVGSIGPMVGQPGIQVTIAGDGFGTTAGTVKINGATASVMSWSNTSVTFAVPGTASGVTSAVLANAAGVAANPIRFTVLESKLVPVPFTVNNAAPTQPGDNIFLTGNGFTLGNWGTTFDTAVGPMLAPDYPKWFLNVSVPAGQTIQFKFIRIAANGSVTWEGGQNHTFTVPASGTGAVNVDWQP